MSAEIISFAERAEARRLSREFMAITDDDIASRWLADLDIEVFVDLMPYFERRALRRACEFIVRAAPTEIGKALGYTPEEP